MGRFIGYTGCRDPEIHFEMLKHGERFDTCLMPLHIADTCFSDSPKMSFERKRQTNCTREGFYRQRAAQAAGVRSARF